MATEETVSTIAKALGETDELPMTQITGVVRVLGEELCLKLLEETKQLEDKGGMMLPDGSRRRTIGGVFFFLARQKLSREDKLVIFRAPKPAKGPDSEGTAEANPFPRRRVIDVAPTRPPSARPPRPGFLPPELPLAVKKVKVREGVRTTLSALPAEDQYGLLLDILAELHDQLGYRLPESQRSHTSFDPPTRPGTTGPASSQRPIPVPDAARPAGELPQGETGAADPVKQKRAAVRAKRN